jgi:hypothetical protein
MLTLFTICITAPLLMLLFFVALAVGPLVVLLRLFFWFSVVLLRMMFVPLALLVRLSFLPSTSCCGAECVRREGASA